MACLLYFIRYQNIKLLTPKAYDKMYASYSLAMTLQIKHNEGLTLKIK